MYDFYGLGSRYRKSSRLQTPNGRKFHIPYYRYTRRKKQTRLSLRTPFVAICIRRTTYTHHCRVHARRSITIINSTNLWRINAGARRRTKINSHRFFLVKNLLLRSVAFLIPIIKCPIQYIYTRTYIHSCISAHVGETRTFGKTTSFYYYLFLGQF